jgi:3-oxoacyl-[acyl-carrier protein] reductase
MATKSNRVAIITGGTRGIGRAVSTMLAAQGFSVLATYAGDSVKAAQTVDGIRAAGGSVLAVCADVADESTMVQVFETAIAEFGGVDVVVNVAAVDPIRKPLIDVDLREFDAAVRTNLRGTLVTNKLAASHVRSGGAIINFSSCAVRFRNEGSIAYVASKAGVDALTLALARELRGRDVTVNAVSPGPVETEMLQAHIAIHGEGVRDSLAKLSPLGRVGIPDDIAQVVLFLATTGRWINGQVIQVSGGAV